MDPHGGDERKALLKMLSAPGYGHELRLAVAKGVRYLRHQN